MASSSAKDLSPKYCDDEDDGDYDSDTDEGSDEYDTKVPEKPLPVPDPHAVKATAGGPIMKAGGLTPKLPVTAPGKQSGGRVAGGSKGEGAGSMQGGGALTLEVAAGGDPGARAPSMRSLRSIRSLANQHWSKSVGSGIMDSSEISEVPTEMGSRHGSSSGARSSFTVSPHRGAASPLPPGGGPGGGPGGFLGRIAEDKAGGASPSPGGAKGRRGTPSFPPPGVRAPALAPPGVRPPASPPPPSAAAAAAKPAPGGGSDFTLEVDDLAADLDLSMDIHELSMASGLELCLDGGGDDDGGLGLDIGRIEAENAALAEESYRISESGTMLIDGFEIRQSGLAINSKKGIGSGSAQGRGRSTKPSSGQDAQDDENTQIFEMMNDNEGKFVARTHTSPQLLAHFVQLCPLGRGASGVVFKALHAPTLTLVAQKVINVLDEGKRRQMARELRALYSNLVSLRARQDAPHLASPCKQIVAFYDTFVDPKEGSISIIVEYMDGGSLQDIVDTGGCDNESVLANISYQVLKGLKFLHDQKQMHRDIKPANLLINHHGHVKVSDFGIVRDVEYTNEQVDTFTGTYFYMSPERIMGKEYSYNSDIWSLGLTIMTCALGRFPYGEDTGYWGLLQEISSRPPPELPADADWSAELRSFLARCLAKDPAGRPGASELLGHPFVAGPAAQDGDGDAPPDPEEEEAGGETARGELDDVAGAVRRYYGDLWAAQARRRESPTVPNLHATKLRGLALQLGLPVATVQRRMAAVLADLKRELHGLYAPLAAAEKGETDEDYHYDDEYGSKRGGAEGK